MSSNHNNTSTTTVAVSSSPAASSSESNENRILVDSTTSSNNPKPKNATTTTATSRDNQDASTLPLYRRRQFLLDQMKQEIVPLTIGSLALLASSISNQAFPRLMGRLIDQTISNKTIATLVLCGGIASFARTTILKYTKDSIATRLRQQALTCLLYRDMEWFLQSTQEATTPIESATTPMDDTSTSDRNASDKDASSVSRSPTSLSNILTHDVDQISTMLTTTVANVIRSCSSIFLSTYQMICLDLQLVTISLSIIPIVGASAMILRKSIQSLLTQQRQCATELQEFVFEKLHHVSIVQLAHRQHDEIHEYQQLQQRALLQDRIVAQYQGMLMGYLFVSTASGLLLVIHYGNKSVQQQRMTSGQLTSFVTYSFLLGLGTSGLIQGWSEITHGLVSTHRFLPLLEQQPESSTTTLSASSATHDDKASDVQGLLEKEPTHVSLALTSSPIGSDDDHKLLHSIAMEGVSFGYRQSSSSQPHGTTNNVHKLVLHNINLKLECGTVTALVGPNGSGKSTTSALLSGLLQPTTGRIVLSNGQELQELSPAQRAQFIQVLPQNASTALWNRSIYDNVTYCRPDATYEQVQQALELAGCTEWIATLPNGMQHIVGRNGSHLSGGQAQRIMLARALLCEPTILIMDEPASNLDSHGETAIAQALIAAQQQQLSSKKGILIITHNPKTLELVDRIVVMKDGTIVEAGTLTELKHPHSQLCHVMPDVLDMM